MPTSSNNNRNGGDNNNNNNDMEKLDMEMEEEEMVFEKMDEKDQEELMQEVDLESQSFWPLRIKSIRDIMIHVRPTDSIANVKQAVLEGLDKCTDEEAAADYEYYVRLVCKGRLLAPDQAPLNSLNSLVQPYDVVHAVLTKIPKSSSPSSSRRPHRQRGVQAALQRGTGLSRRALRSAGINESGLAVRRSAAEQEELDDEEDDDQSVSSDEAVFGGRTNNRTQQQHRRGFDQLRNIGLRRGEIAALRSYFSRQVDRFVAQQPPEGEAAATEDPLLRRLLQEEAWMQSQGPLSEFRLNLPNGSLALLNLISSSNNNNNRAATGGENNNPWLLSGGDNNNDATNPDREALLWRAAGGVGSTTGAAAATTATNLVGDRNGPCRHPSPDFWCGFMLGFNVGFIMLVWVCIPTVSDRQKLGILVGITVQLAVSRPPENDDPNSGGHLASSGANHPLIRGSGYVHLLGEDRTIDDGVVLG